MTARLLDPLSTTAVAVDATTGPDDAARRLSRAAAVALVAGAALNTMQALIMRTVDRPETGADKLALVDAHPVAMLVMILGGMLGVVLLLPTLQAVARLVGPSASRTARVGGALAFAGTLAFFGMHAVMVVTYALAGMDDRAAAVAVLDHLDSSALTLVLEAPFLLGMFGGVALLTAGLLRTPGVARWAVGCWALFLPLDLLAAGALPVDPHWLFLAGAVGIALSGRAGRKS